MTSFVKSSTTMNRSGYHPRGRAVLILPEELLQKVKESVPTLKKLGFKIPDTVQARANMLEEKGLLVEVGAAAWSDEPEPRASVGDMVLVSQWCGTLIDGKDGKTYRMCNADDVYCTVDSDDEEVAEAVA